MAFLRINGLDVSVLVEDFDLRDASVEHYDRAVDDSLQGTTYSVKRELSFVTPPMSVADARALEGWVRGRCHQWTFDRVDSATTRYTRFSADGGLAFGTAATNSESELFGTHCLQLNATITTTATATFGSEGDWSVSCYHHSNATTTFYNHAVRSRTGTINAVNGSTASVGTLGFLSVTAVSGFLSLTLKALTAASVAAGSASTCRYDEVRIYPYALTDDMFAALAVSSSGSITGLPSTGPGDAPYVTVMGDALMEADVNATTSGEAGPMLAKGFVDTVETEVAVIDGVSQAARRLRIKLVQR